MDTETWNEKLQAMRGANDRGERLMEAHHAIAQARTIVQELGLEAMARQLNEPYRDSFRDAGEEPPD
jgi:hypothetical protein